MRAASSSPGPSRRRRRQPIWRTIATVGLALMILSVLPALPAEAANPTISVTPSSLVLDSGEQGVVKISWSVGGLLAPANVRYHTEADPQWQITAWTGHSGTDKPFTVACCHTYTFALFSTAGGQMLNATPATVETKLKIKLDLGCLIQCITQGTVQPHGTYADFAIKTNETAMLSIQASTQPPNADGTFTGKPIAASLFAFLPSTQFNGQLLDLTPSTLYHYAITAVDANGHTARKTGSFVTLKRHVKLTFTKIWVTDDGDGGFSGAGDFHFMAKINGQDLDAFTNPPSIYFFIGDISTGEQVPLNFHVTFPNNGDDVQIYVLGQDHDGTFECGYGAKCDDWNETSKTVNVAKSGPGVEAFTTNVKLVATPGDVGFEVFITVQVFYQ
ncbi:MAG: hypothetical protein U0821_22465 [Chloroflexota bacterium]